MTTSVCPSAWGWYAVVIFEGRLDGTVECEPIVAGEERVSVAYDGLGESISSEYVFDVQLHLRRIDMWRHVTFLLAGKSVDQWCVLVRDGLLPRGHLRHAGSGSQ